MDVQNSNLGHRQKTKTHKKKIRTPFKNPQTHKVTTNAPPRF